MKIKLPRTPHISSLQKQEVGMNNRGPFFKIVSCIVVFSFLFTQIAWSETAQYVPFDETQQNSDYLSTDQLQRFSEIKNTLIDQHNTVNSPPLETEEEIIQYLYSILAADDYSTLIQLENNYNASVAQKEATWQALTDQKSSLDDYYQQLDYLNASLQSVYLQIDSVTAKISNVEQDKTNEQQEIQALQGQLASKISSIQAELQGASTLETDLTNLENALVLLQQEKNVSKNDLDAAEALYNEKAAQKS